MRRSGDSYTYGSSGAGGLSHLAGALFASLAKGEWIHVPYKGAAAQDYVELLNRSIVEALKAPEVGPRFAADGSEPVGNSPSQFAAHIKAGFDHRKVANFHAGQTIIPRLSPAVTLSLHGSAFKSALKRLKFCT